MKESRMANSEGMPVVQLQQFAPQWVQLMLATLYGEPCKVGRTSSLFGLGIGILISTGNQRPGVPLIMHSMSLNL